MNNPNAKRINLWLPILFSLVLMLGMYFGFLLNNSATLKKSITSIIQNNRMEEIIDLIDNRYVDEIDEEDLYRDGINGILNNLDPHTYYIPVENVAATNDQLRGSYKGLGLEYSILKDTLVITSIVENGPAAVSGLTLGDKIIAINNEVVSKEATSMDQVRSVIKAITNDTITLDIISARSKEYLSKSLVRSTIHVNSVEAAYYLAKQIGYIRIGKFTEYTYEEFKYALQQLDPSSLNGLVIDLRQNSGGYLEAAIKILDELLDDNKLLLSINGKSFIKDEYVATTGGLYESGKLAILIDETSASSSEILAGAIQDWDRGVIIGRKSFGKGLVQEQFDLSDGSALRLTIAKYYTPAGRSIQRDYSIGKEKYFEENDARMNSYNNWEASQSTDDTFYTLLHKRFIYANDGIVPDVLIRYKDFMLSPNLWHVANGLDPFVNDYFVKNLNQFIVYGSLEEFMTKFQITPHLLNAFKGSIQEQFTDNVNSVWKNPLKIDYIKILLKAHFARLLFRKDGYYKVLNQQNDIVAKAIYILQSDKEYHKILNPVNR